MNRSLDIRKLLLAVAATVGICAIAGGKPVVPKTSPRGAAGELIRVFTSPEEMHARYTEDFASRPGFGKSRVVFLPPQDFLSFEDRRYRFQTPALLGLEGPPAAYVSPHRLLTVSDLSDSKPGIRIQKRALSHPELQAVEQLRAGADLVKSVQDFPVVVGGDTQSVRGLLVVGALRAGTRCAECHRTPEGTLLGAFAYTLIPEPPNTPSESGGQGLAAADRQRSDLAGDSCR